MAFLPTLPKKEEPRRGGLLGMYDTATRRNASSGLNPLQELAAGLDAMIMPEMRMGGAIRQQGASNVARNKKNSTVEMLRTQGRDDLADAVERGTIDFAQAFGVMQSDKASDKAFGQQKELARLTASLTAPKAVKTPTSVQEYQYAVANNQLPEGVSTFPEYERFIARAGRNVPDQTMHPTLNRPLTTFELEKDKKYADLLPDLTLSGISTAARNAATIKTVIEQLGNPKEGQDLTGPYQGMLGTLGRNIFATESQEAFNNVASVLQQSLREILGGQFAEKEGAALIARGYDIYAPPEVNAARLRALYTQLEATAANKAKLMEYTGTYGTTAGFGGSASQPDVQDFYSAMSQAEKGLGFNQPKSTGVNNVEQYRLNPQTGKVERVNAN